MGVFIRSYYFSYLLGIFYYFIIFLNLIELFLMFLLVSNRFAVNSIHLFELVSIVVHLL